MGIKQYSPFGIHPSPVMMC